MLYLIRSYGIKGKSILKLGYTDSYERRMSQYFYSNPFFQIVSVREGDDILEKLFHYYLYFLGYQFKIDGKLDEWFIDVPEIYQLFHISQETLEKKIWKHRNEIFNKDKIISPIDNKDSFLFNYLYDKNQASFKAERIKTIDKTSIDYLFYKRYLSLSTKELLAKENKDSLEFIDFKIKFDRLKFFTEKLKLFCEFMDVYREVEYLVNLVSIYVSNPDFQKFYDFYGTKGCKARLFQRGELERGMKDTLNLEINKTQIYNSFEIGKRYTLKDIKLSLGSLYRSNNISKTPKAKDLEEYFNVTEVKIYDPVAKKQSKGYLIVSRK